MSTPGTIPLHLVRQRGSQWWVSALLFTIVMVGTAGRAEQTLVNAEAAARIVAQEKPGSVILLADGVYPNLALTLKAAGTAEKPITFRAQTPGRVLITGRSTLTISGEHLVVSGLLFDQVWNRNVVAFEAAQNCQLTDCAFLECGNPESTFSHIVTLHKISTQNRVDHCYFQGNLSIGIGVRVSETDFQNTGNRFDHNYFKDIFRRSSNGQEAIQVGQGKPSVAREMHTWVEHCLFDNASGDDEIISNKSSCNRYQFNTFTNCRGSLTLRGGASITVLGNIFLACKTGIRVHAPYSAIVGNYIKGCDYGIMLPMGTGAALDSEGHVAPHHCVFANNLVLDCKNSAVNIGAKIMGERPDYTVAPFANAFYNNVLRSSRGLLLQFLVENDSVWRETSVFAEGKAQLGAKPEGMIVEAVGLDRSNPLVLPLNRLARIQAFEGDLKARLAGMKSPPTMEELFPARLELQPLKPKEVGPAWMHGDPQSIRRIANPQPIPLYPGAKKR